MLDISSDQRWKQASWLLLALLGAVMWLFGPASQSLGIRSLCRPTSCTAYRLDAVGASALSAHHVSLTAYAVLTLITLGLLSVTWYGLAGLIMLRKPDDRGAVLAAFFLVLFPLLEIATWIPSAPLLLKTVLPAVGITVLLLFCLLFPDGRFAPAWTRWIIPLAILGGISAVFPMTIRAPIFAIALAAVVAAQIARFRSVLSWSYRQQTKWALYGVATASVGFAALVVGAILLPSTQTGRGGLFTSFANSTGLALAASPIPVTIGIAILRYHLWDINRVASLTLVYSTLTIVLAGIYAGGVIGLQHVLQLVTGRGSSIAVALSTLAVAALFGPLRRRIQARIDRYFFRARYDAARIVSSFAGRLRHEFELTNLTHDLTGVIEETLSPEHVSIWLNRETRD